MLLLSAKQLTGAEGEAHNIDRILGLLLDLNQHVEYSFASQIRSLVLRILRQVNQCPRRCKELWVRHGVQSSSQKACRQRVYVKDEYWEDAEPLHSDLPIGDTLVARYS